MVEVSGEIESLVPQFSSHITSQVSLSCIQNLEPAHTVPRLYRRTNREVRLANHALPTSMEHTLHYHSIIKAHHHLPLLNASQSSLYVVNHPPTVVDSVGERKSILMFICTLFRVALSPCLHHRNATCVLNQWSFNSPRTTHNHKQLAASFSIHSNILRPLCCDTANTANTLGEPLVVLYLVHFSSSDIVNLAFFLPTQLFSDTISLSVLYAG